MNGEERLFITLCVLLGALIVCVIAIVTAKNKPNPPQSSRDLSRDLPRWLGIALALVALGGFAEETNAACGATQTIPVRVSVPQMAVRTCGDFSPSSCPAGAYLTGFNVYSGGSKRLGCPGGPDQWNTAYQITADIETYCRVCNNACEADPTYKEDCPAGQIWDPNACACKSPGCGDNGGSCPFFKCQTYWNDGQGGKDPLRPGEIPLTGNFGGGGGYYAHVVIASDPCACTGDHIIEDAPATCEEMGYCKSGNACIYSDRRGEGYSSSSGANSSSSSPPVNCTCIGCFGGNCSVMCDDGSTRTCVGDFSSCGELKNSPTWATCTEPISSPSSSASSGASSSDSQSSPSSQANDLDALNAIIDTLHHSNELQEIGHQNQKDIADKIDQNNTQNGGFFAAALSYLKGLLGNTQNQVNKQNATNNKLDDIANKLDDIKNRPRDTTIINISSPSGGGGETGGSDTTIVNISFGIDSNIGAGKWDTATATAGYKNSYDSAAAYWDSTAAAADGDTIPSAGEMMQAYKDGFVSFRDSGAGKMYRDTLGAIAEKFIDNGTLTGSGSNSCPSVLTRSMTFNIAGITANPNLTLGTYLCTPVFGGVTGWTLGRTLLRALVSIACMFFLFKCATGTLGGEE